MSVDLNLYKDFVAAVTSKESNDFMSFQERLTDLFATDSVNVPLLLTGAIGLGAESGELQEIVKKMLFQGKPLNEENIFHMKRELGDIMWYWINTCRALNLDPNDVIDENVRKLESRYPGGHFSAWHSENRKQGDL
jgi:NTP pyrophosphatase (non-canonical NTP hydrolase)